MIRNSKFMFEKIEFCMVPRVYHLFGSESAYFRCNSWLLPRPLSSHCPFVVGSRELSVCSTAFKHLRIPSTQRESCNNFSTSTHKPSKYFNENKFKEEFKEATGYLREGECRNEIQDAVVHLDQMIDYNVFGGKMNRAMIVLSSFNLLASPDQLTDKNQQKAVLLGWCVELLQACFLVADDIMDQSTMRRGKPCWYKINGVGLSGFNDAFLLYSSIHSILRSNFKDDPCYIYLVELFEKVLQQTTIGQSLDLLTSPIGNTDLTRFTEERYDAIVKWKTGFYSFYMPVALALYLDDYLDCYGEPETIGKVGTDIEENKCSWLIVQALKLANEDQRKALQTNYGLDDPKKVAIVKTIYHELQLESIYKKFELESYEDIQREIDNMKSDLPKQLFLEYATRIFQREK
ncbi:farnesyl pyrophosphate synthase-like isoform X2 [Antedon mediterranea]|uniref:farnesyl pyrophosphate synthase-like isoform X2 n=1 Tax=Antedon mediterranea TaxID=105859 RepID=UPI003AF69F93